MKSYACGASLVLLSLVACKSAQPELPGGAGLIACDEAPPAGAETFAQPTWRNGERRVFLRGDVLRIEVRVAAEGDGYRLRDDQSGLETLYTSTLAELGQRKSGAPELALTLDPADYRLTWPLWVGKRWSSHFVRRTPEHAVTPCVANYHCDAVEDVTVPAGTFRCLRIWCRARLAVPGVFPEHTSITWYAPELGYAVRTLGDDGLLTELLAREAN